MNRITGPGQSRRTALRVLGERAAAIALGGSFMRSLAQPRRLLVRGGRVVNVDGVRSADVLQQQAAFGAWKRGVCPVCGGEPDFACITTTGDRLLICGRCQTRWPTEPYRCPFCGENDKQRITSFATPDGTYRVTACQSCLRYLKTLDGRRAGRQVMPVVDSIATLPLDAVVMQRGFSND